MKRSIRPVDKSAIILGGGIAGLTAATELLQRDWHVTVVEAKERLGGRIHTAPKGKMPVELGAEFIHGESSLLERLIKAANLTTHEVPEKNQVLAKRRLEPVPLWEQVSEVVNRIDPQQPDQSFSEFLDAERVSARDRELALGFVQGFNAADPNRISAHALRRADFSAQRSGGGKNARINSGYGALVAALEMQARTRGAVVLTGATARAVKWKNKSVEVVVESGAGTQRLSAAAAIVTLPLGVLKGDAVKFEPSLLRKREAIDALQFGNALKLALVFEEVWWPEHDFG